MILKILLATAILSTALALVSCDSKSEATQGEPTDSAIVQIHRPQSLNAAPPTGNFIATEAAIITSPLTLEKAAKECGLSPEELAKSIHCEQIDNTDLVTIKAYREDEAEAAKILEAVVNAYVLRRHEADKKLREKAWEALDTELQDLGDVANERQKSLTVLIQQYGICSWGTREPAPVEKTHEEMYQAAAERLETLKKDRDQLKISHAIFSQAPANERIAALSKIESPENEIALFYEQYLEFQNKIFAAKEKGLGAQHPLRVGLLKRSDVLRAQARRAAKMLKSVIETKITLIDHQLERIAEIDLEKERQLLPPHMRAHDYDSAKEEYEEARNLLKEAKLQQQKTRSLLKIPHDSITYHKRPGK